MTTAKINTIEETILIKKVNQREGNYKSSLTRFNQSLAEIKADMIDFYRNQIKPFPNPSKIALKVYAGYCKAYLSKIRSIKATTKAQKRYTEAPTVSKHIGIKVDSNRKRARIVKEDNLINKDFEARYGKKLENVNTELWEAILNQVKRQWIKVIPQPVEGEKLTFQSEDIKFVAKKKKNKKGKFVWTFKKVK